MRPRFNTVCVFVCATCAFRAAAAPPPAPDALTENSAGQWSAQAQGASASVFNDNQYVQVGSSSLRYETDAPFDAWLWSPPARDAHWDLSGISKLRFWVRAQNSNIGFQNSSPWVRLGTGPSTSNYWQYTPNGEVLNGAINTWLMLEIPLAGSTAWQRTQVGTPSFANIDYVEIHADTWGAGFTLWFDGMTFDATPTAPEDVSAIAGDNRVSLAWRPYAAGPGFAYFAIYRQTSPFTSVSGLTPIATVSNSNATGYEDTTAVNGTSYYNAVTAVNNQGGQVTQVQAIGPRTPRHETDLQVTYIERTPRYPRYDPIYTYYEITEPSGFGPYAFTAATGLGMGQNASTQRFPNVGDVITYTAHIRNRGTVNVAGPISGTWRYDGNVIGTANVNGPLAPGASTGTFITRVWDGQSHTISFTIDTPDERANNNMLAQDTNAVGYLSYIDRSYEENFRETTPQYPQAASDDFIHWLHLHLARMNQMFADAGSAKRVRFDLLEVLSDYDPDPNTPTIYYAVFPFRYRASDGSLRLSGYYDPPDDIDYGLLHEKGHQLGLIDLYRMDLPGENNLVSGQGYSTVACLMHGVSHFFSAHSALAMNHWLNVAHGYFGQYLYSTPATIRMRFRGPDGQPLVGATVKMYQKLEVPGVGEIIPNSIKAQGVTNANGEWDLPNVPIDTSLVPTTFAGDTLYPNPFGYIAVVGTNGLLHFRVEKNGGVDYAWLDLPQVNTAYWQGQTDVAVFERQVAVGGPIQFVPPVDMTELNASDWVAWAQGSDATNTYVVNDTSAGFHPVGQGSIKFVTDGGFDTSIRYPGTLTAHWNLAGTSLLHIQLRTQNPNIGFQNGSPWIRLLDADNNYFQYQYYQNGAPFDLLNQTIGAWHSYSIPVNAPPNPLNGWGRTSVGTPSLANMHYIEIHADTWGGGFTMWVDGLNFTPQPFIANDSNGDCHADLRDFAALQACFGTSSPCSAPQCTPFLNGGCTVDLADYATFQAALSGPVQYLSQCAP